MNRSAGHVLRYFDLLPTCLPDGFAHSITKDIVDSKDGGRLASIRRDEERAGLIRTTPAARRRENSSNSWVRFVPILKKRREDLRAERRARVFPLSLLFALPPKLDAIGYYPTGTYSTFATARSTPPRAPRINALAHSRNVRYV